MLETTMPLEIRDAIMCKFFPQSLKGPALKWFCQLTLKSIGSLKEMTKVFIKNYSVNVNQRATSKILCTIVEQTDERFSIALVEIPKCDDIVALFVLQRGLLPRLSFLDEICNWKPRTIAKALGRAWGMIEVEGFWRTAKLERLNHSRREQYQGDENDSGQRPTSPSQDESYDMSHHNK
ncbi:hypothetical protein TIFTF001_038434 [Ficus carica]|uniref:Retrotransposon gag domain-containing protein n=1 Tax=Ficus carica TaxID=3494 RepID=A0AA88JD23_FICCA|nr:hypothetical protein TIFTF001_038418 [Ficus carica]GMN69370.1 hypothetical protein TIFTF001_038424 [Ficus carica]GMN69379.1 hypothetical protein TIFTF001_038428 [Ficus carica]GMN69380.1 hypothetical protein TIFTF001_038434 [Ficus carica]